MKIKKIIYVYTFSFFSSYCYNPQYFCTAANAKYFDGLKALIGSIHKSNFDHLGQIAVFNLGLTKKQIDEINSMEKVKVYEVKLTHPDLLKPFNVFGNKWVPGWYAWKPVVIKQALDLFPYVVWQDAGNLTFRPLDDLFTHIIQKGYFLNRAGNLNKNHTTHYIIKKFNLDSQNNKWILELPQVEAGLIGISRTCTIAYEKFLLPVYELTKDLKNFEDDGTCPLGFGWARYEQPLFTMLAYQLGLEIFTKYKKPTQIYLHVDNQKIPFYLDSPKGFDENTHITFRISFMRQEFINYIRYKKITFLPQKKYVI